MAALCIAAGVGDNGSTKLAHPAAPSLCPAVPGWAVPAHPGAWLGQELLPPLQPSTPCCSQGWHKHNSDPQPSMPHKCQGKKGCLKVFLGTVTQVCWPGWVTNTWSSISPHLPSAVNVALCRMMFSFEHRRLLPGAVNFLQMGSRTHHLSSGNPLQCLLLLRRAGEQLKARCSHPAGPQGWEQPLGTVVPVNPLFGEGESISKDLLMLLQIPELALVN